MIVRIEHARAAGYCSSGMRTFCQRYGFDWMDFLMNGIEAERLEATGDWMALQVVEVARGNVR